VLFIIMLFRQESTSDAGAHDFLLLRTWLHWEI